MDIIRPSVNKNSPADFFSTYGRFILFEIILRLFRKDKTYQSRLQSNILSQRLKSAPNINKFRSVSRCIPWAGGLKKATNNRSNRNRCLSQSHAVARLPNSSIFLRLRPDNLYWALNNWRHRWQGNVPKANSQKSDTSLRWRSILLICLALGSHFLQMMLYRCWQDMSHLIKTYAQSTYVCTSATKTKQVHPSPFYAGWHLCQSAERNLRQNYVSI